MDGQLTLVGTAQWTTLGPEDLTALVKATEKPTAPSTVMNIASSANLSHASRPKPSSRAASPDPPRHHYTEGRALPMPPHNILPNDQSKDISPLKVLERTLEAIPRSDRQISPNQTLTGSEKSINAPYREVGKLRRRFVKDSDAAVSSRPATPSGVDFGAAKPAISNSESPTYTEELVIGPQLVLNRGSKTALSSRSRTPSRVDIGAAKPAISNGESLTYPEEPVIGLQRVWNVEPSFPQPATSTGESLAYLEDVPSADHSLSKPTPRQSRAQRWKRPGGLLQSIYSVFQPSMDRSSMDRSTPTMPQPNQEPGKWEDPLSRDILEPEHVQELISRCTKELKARGKTPICAFRQIRI